MGSERSTRTRLVARCCYGASFGFGFVLTILTLATMFWIAWCYFGLTIVQITDTQRRALVNYSFTTAKPSPTPTTSPTRSTTVATEETSINSISKLPTTETVLRGSSRGESQVKIDKKKEPAVVSSLAKGDFATRDRVTHSRNATSVPSKDTSSSSVALPRGPPRPKDEPRPSSGQKAAILTASSEDSEEDRIYARRVLPPGPENRPEEKGQSEKDSRPDISPTKVYDIEATSGTSRRLQEPEPERRDEDRDKTGPSRRDEIQSSRRSDSDPAYRDPDFDREYTRKQGSDVDRGKSRYDDVDDERGSKSRYDRRDRGRDTDDRYSKGDTRVYPDDREFPAGRPLSEDRYRDRVRERYPDDTRRGDDDRYDDRYRDYDERPRYRDRDQDTTKYREDRMPIRDDRYKDRDDDDKYRSRSDDRYTSRDDDRYRSRDDDRYRSRNDDRYKYRDDDRLISRDDDRYRADDDDRYRRYDDRYTSRDDSRYNRDPEDRRDLSPRYRDEKDVYRPRVDDDKRTDVSPPRSRDADFRISTSRSSSDLPVDRKPSSRSEYDGRSEVRRTDFDAPLQERGRPYGREELNPSRLSRPYDEERYRDRDDDYRPPRYDDEERRISPTRTREDVPLPRSSLIDPRPKEPNEEARYIDSPRDSRIRDDKYYDQDDRIRNTRLQSSRVSVPISESTRRLINDRDEYRTKLPNERAEEVVLDRRSYVLEDDDEYRKQNTRRNYDYDDRNRGLPGDPRRKYTDDERSSYRDPDDDDEYKRSRTRENYDTDRVRNRDRYDDDYRRSDSRDDDRYLSRNDRPSSFPSSRYDAYPEDDDRTRRRDIDTGTPRKEDSRDRGETVRSSIPSRSDDDRLYSRDKYPESRSSSRRRYDDDLSLPDNRDDYSNDRRRPGTSRTSNDKEPLYGSSVTSVYSREPSDVVIREKRYQNAENRQNSRIITPAEIYSDRNYGDTGLSKSRDAQVRPLSPKDVIEAAIRHSDSTDQNSRKVYYPVFDPRVSNLTSEIIRPSERRGTTITAKKKRSI